MVKEMPVAEISMYTHDIVWSCYKNELRGIANKGLRNGGLGSVSKAPVDPRRFLISNCQEPITIFVDSNGMD
jgi:hypothetical protein